MVDFQSRDTRRGVSDESDEDRDDEADTAEDGETEQAQSADESQSPDQPERQPAPSTGKQGSPANADPDVTDGPTGTDPTASERTTRGAATAEPVRGEVRPVDVALVTIGDATTPDGEPNSVTERLTDSLTTAGHTVTVTRELQGGYDEVQQAIDSLVARPDVEAVVSVGGTGVAQSDVVIEAVHPLFEKVLPGFGEVVRNLLFYQAGTGVVGIRTAAGITGGCPVFCLPGERRLANRAVEEVVVTEAPAIVAELE